MVLSVIYVSVFICRYIFKYMYMCICKYTYICMYIYIYTCIYIYTHLYIYIYIAQHLLVEQVVLPVMLGVLLGGAANLFALNRELI